MLQIISLNTTGNPKPFFNEHKCMMQLSCVFPLSKSVNINPIFCGCLMILYAFITCLSFPRSYHQTVPYSKILDAAYMTQNHCDSDYVCSWIKQKELLGTIVNVDLELL